MIPVKALDCDLNVLCLLLYYLLLLLLDMFEADTELVKIEIKFYQLLVRMASVCTSAHVIVMSI